MPIINRFDGGLATGIDAIYLNNSQSTKLLNANIERVGVKSALEPTKIGEATKSFYQFPILDAEPEEMFVASSQDNRSYAEFMGALCYSNGGPVCKVTTGIMNDEGVDFLWKTIGIEAPEGELTVEVLGLKHISGASATLFVNPAPFTGAIVSSTIRYRIVDDAGVVYTHSIPDNTGFSTVDFIFPSVGYKVYRETLTWDAEYSDRYILVFNGATDSFTDGQVEVDEKDNPFVKVSVKVKPSHRLSMLGSKSYQSSYSIFSDGITSKLIVDSLQYVTVAGKWSTVDLQSSIVLEEAGDELHRGIASTFVYKDKLYIMAMLHNTFNIYDAQGTIICGSSNGISPEFFKSTTFEYGDLVYLPNPKEGYIGTFNGSVFRAIEKPDLAFPYANAEDSIFVLQKGTNKVFAILNDRHVAYIREFTLPDFTMTATREERIEIPLIRGLGGTSNSDMSSIDFVYFPVHGRIVKFSPEKYAIAKVPSPAKTSTDSDSTLGKGFFFDLMGLTGGVIMGNLFGDIGGDIGEFGMLEPAKTARFRNGVEEWFNEPTLTGTYLYNVAQKTPDGSSEGPMMDIESTPIDIYRGHVIIDVSGVTHTEPLRLYRTGGYLTRFTMVEDIDAVGNYIDKRTDVTIALGRNGNVDYVYAPPEGLQWLTEHRGMLFGAVGNTVYWSQPGQLNAWDELNSFIIVDRNVTGLASVGSGLLIFMRGRIKLLMGDSRLTFALRTVTNEKGTIDSYSIQAVKGGALFFSEDGLCFTDGSQIQELSYDILGKKGFNTSDSSTTNRSYYAILNSFTSNLLLEARYLLRYDFGKAPVFSLLSADKVEGIGEIDGKLAHSYEGELFNTLGYGDRIFNYRSGDITEGMPTMIKEWDRVRISGTFIGELFVYIDNKCVMKEKLNLKTVGVFNSHIKKEDNKGKAIAFEVLGKGAIESIEYSITGRKTTK